MWACFYANFAYLQSDTNKFLRLFLKLVFPLSHALVKSNVK